MLRFLHGASPRWTHWLHWPKLRSAPSVIIFASVQYFLALSSRLQAVITYSVISLHVWIWQPAEGWMCLSLLTSRRVDNYSLKPVNVSWLTGVQYLCFQDMFHQLLILSSLYLIDLGVSIALNNTFSVHAHFWWSRLKMLMTTFATINLLLFRVLQHSPFATDLHDYFSGAFLLCLFFLYDFIFIPRAHYTQRAHSY